MVPRLHFLLCTNVNLQNLAIGVKLHIGNWTLVIPALRYVYVKASGVEDRWRSIFSVVLCEIMVY